MHPMRRFLTLLLATPFLIVLLSVTGTAQQQLPPAGTVSRIQGAAVAVRNTLPRWLSVGDAIQVGDVLSTGTDSRLEIKMLNDAIFVLGAETAFVVTDWTACSWWSGNNVSPKRPLRPSWAAGVAERSRTASLGGSLPAPAPDSRARCADGPCCSARATAR